MCVFVFKLLIICVCVCKGWKIYDCGPKKVKCPLVCLPSVSGTADVFYRQALALSAKGIRVICAEAPIYWNVRQWCEGFRKLLDHLELDRVHLLGASLGKPTFVNNSISLVRNLKSKNQSWGVH